MLTHRDFFDLSDFPFADVFPDDVWVWETLDELKPWLARFLAANPPVRDGQIADSAVLKGDVWVEDGAVIEDQVCILGPAIICRGAEIKQGAYVRDGCIIGPDAVVGHTTEVKHAILLNEAKAPHFAYVGDSILGVDTNLGAGTKLSNLPVSSEKDETGQRTLIEIVINGERISTGRSKLGAIIGDRSQTGCNSVTNPGTLIGRDTLVYPNVSLAKGYYPDSSIVKLRQTLDIVARR